MSYTYNEKEIKTKEDAIIALEEIKAYQELEGLSFDFGNGLIQNDLSYGTEHVYWKMDAKVLEEIIEDWEEDIEWANWLKSQSKKKYKKQKLNRYYRKTIDKRKLIKLSKTSWWIVYYNEKENRYIRCYYSGRKSYAKWCSDKTVRNSNDFSLIGAGYRKCFNYWYTVF